MSKFAAAVTAANEIVKAADFSFSHDQSIANVAVAMRGFLAVPGQDMVIGGEVKPYQSVGLSVCVEPVFVHSGNGGLDVVDMETNQPVPIEPAGQTSGRMDTLQVRGIEELYDYQDRRFRDPESKAETVANVATKKRVKLDIAVKKGSDGSVLSPQTDDGWVKLAEISVPAGTVSITQEHIRNVSARYAGGENTGWTNQKAGTFNPGYLTDIMGKFLESHGEDGRLKAGAVLAAMIKFGNGGGEVNGGCIPSGVSMEITGTQHDPLLPVSYVLEALAEAVNSAYPHANNLFSRYALLPHSPLVASTQNVDVAKGGEILVDGIACADGNMVLLKDQDSPKENGLWEVRTGAWNRSAGYAAENADVFNNKLVLCTGGKTNRGKVFYLDGESAVGRDGLVFRESVFSPCDLPGKVPIRDLKGRTVEDDKRETGDTDTLASAREYADSLKKKAETDGFSSSGENVLVRGGTWKQPLLRFYEGSGDGGAAVMQSGGLIILGSGESALAVYKGVTGEGKKPDSEDAFLASDGPVHIMAGLQNGYASGKKATLDAAGNLTVPGAVKIPAKTTAPGTDGTLVATEGQVKAALDKKANLESPTFTGTVKVPAKTAAAAAANSTLVATEAQVALKANIASPAFTGSPTAPTPAAGTNTTAVATAAFVTAAVKAAKLEMYPKGAIYLSVTNTNPATFLGGTWTAWGAGRVPVGVAASGTFNTVEKTGGAETHKLVAGEMPAHTHTSAAHTHGSAGHTHTATGSATFDQISGLASHSSHNKYGLAYGMSAGTVTVSLSGAATGSTTPGATASTTPSATGSAGSGTAHNNLQPYITCYMWKRTA